MLRDSFVRRLARSSMRLAAFGVGLATLAAFASPREASAFCRSTTCTEDCPRDLDGCKTSGQALWWANSWVGFSLQQDASVHIPIKYVRQVATRSFTAWSDLECETGFATLAFSELEEAECKRTEYNDGGQNSNIILFQDNKWDYKGADNTLAKTTVSFDAVSGEIFDADIEINHHSTAVCHLGNIAVRTGKKIQWDPKTETIVGDSEASMWLTKEYRKPYILG